MKQFKNYEDAAKRAQSMGGQRLPVGAYVCKIMNVRYDEGQNGNSDMITLQFDIDEGELKGFFKKQYEENTAEDKKWKGKVTIYVPKDDGTEHDGWTMNKFATWTTGFEASNEGYKWDWDENKWKGLIIGILFGETGTVIDGKEIVYTEPRRGCSAQLVRDGKAPKAKFIAKRGYTGNGNPGGNNNSSDDFMSVSDGAEEDIPF